MIFIKILIIMYGNIINFKINVFLFVIKRMFVKEQQYFIYYKSKTKQVNVHVIISLHNYTSFKLIYYYIFRPIVWRLPDYI